MSSAWKLQDNGVANKILRKGVVDYIELSKNCRAKANVGEVRCLKVFVACNKEDHQEFIRFLTAGGAEVLKKMCDRLFCVE